MKPFVRAAFAAAVVLAANGCGQADTTSTTSETGPTTPPTEEAATPDGVVTSVDQLADGFWQPVRAGGADVDLTEGDYWEFLTRDDQLLVIGFDGCNGFGSSSGPNGAPTAIEDGRLVNVEVASEAMACDAVAYGPYPEDGDILTLTDNGSRLERLRQHWNTSRTHPSGRDPDATTRRNTNEWSIGHEPADHRSAATSRNCGVDSTDRPRRRNCSMRG